MINPDATVNVVLTNVLLLAKTCYQKLLIILELEISVRKTSSLKSW